VVPLAQEAEKEIHQHRLEPIGLSQVVCYRCPPHRILVVRWRTSLICNGSRGRNAPSIDLG